MSNSFMTAVGDKIKMTSGRWSFGLQDGTHAVSTKVTSSKDILYAGITEYHEPGNVSNATVDISHSGNALNLGVQYVSSGGGTCYIDYFYVTK